MFICVCMRILYVYISEKIGPMKKQIALLLLILSFFKKKTYI